MDRKKIDELIEAIGIIKTCEFKGDDKMQHVVFRTANGGIKVPVITEGYEAHNEYMQNFIGLLNDAVGPILENYKNYLKEQLTEELDRPDNSPTE